ncbi:MAG: hypothetical protein HY063_14000 [Bacteroidetes bacterium]|nr:hypothetical protein [Bacteroidota bacterium]
MKKGCTIIFLLTLTFFSIAFSQNNKIENQYELGVKYLTQGIYNKADSLFTLILKKNKFDVDSHVNRAIARKKLGNKCGYCTDLFSAAELEDKEAYSTFWKDCPTYDSIFNCEKGEIIKIKDNQAAANIDIYEWQQINNMFTIKYGYDMSSIKFISVINTNENLNSKYYIDGTDTLYLDIKESPKYIGGINELKKNIGEEIKFSIQNKKVKNSDCLFILYFTIDENGIIKDISRTLFNRNELNVLPQCNARYEEEGVKVINKMSKWMPGKFNGRAVKVRRAIQIKFNINWTDSIPDSFFMIPI